MTWREKYRPTEIEHLAGCEEFKAAASDWVTRKHMPSNLLFVGPPGTGKTSAAGVIARSILGDMFDPINYTISNASDDRGIDYVRELKHLCKQKGIGVARRIFLLDEADSLTPAAQKALRQVMEDSHRTAIFILTANDIGPIHNAIRDRCLAFEFKPLSDEASENRLLHIHTEESLPDAWKEDYRALNRMCNGSLRQAIDTLQGISKNDSALAERLRRDTNLLSKAALNLAGANFPQVAALLANSLEQGLGRIATLKGLRFRVRSLLESEEDWYAFMLTYGEFVLLASQWPDDDLAFVEYFIAKLKKNMEE